MERAGPRTDPSHCPALDDMLAWFADAGFDATEVDPTDIDRCPGESCPICHGAGEERFEEMPQPCAA